MQQPLYWCDARASALNNGSASRALRPANASAARSAATRAALTFGS
jgi:hypothetical protein